MLNSDLPRHGDVGTGTWGLGDVGTWGHGKQGPKDSGT